MADIEFNDPLDPEDAAVAGALARMFQVWACEDCGWRWPLAGSPAEGSECDACGGKLELS
jgi:hypothetical protein